MAFRFSTAVGLLGAAFVGGLYSAKNENILYRGTYRIWDSVKTTIVEIPDLLRLKPIHFLRSARYSGSGVTVNKVASRDLVLLSGFLGDDQKVQLIERGGKVVNSWRLQPREMLPDPGQCRNEPRTDWNSPAHDTIIGPDGSIVVSFESCGMVKLDRCGRKLWATRQITHHSPNFLANGGIVIGGGSYFTGKAPWPFASPYWEDIVRKFDANGRETMARPATTLLLASGMAPMITSSTDFDTRIDGEFHLNDVEELPPALAPKFPMFKAGDLLVSFRNLNLIVVTDSDFRKVKWFKIGPWIRQHDPDWDANGRITVFDNHADGTGDGKVRGGSRIIAIDPATNQTETLYGGRPGQTFYTSERGVHQMQPDGGILITEAYSGRAFQVDRAGRTVWEYVNRYDDSHTAWLHGAEAYPRDYFRVGDWNCKTRT